jgi:hypothetical protein
VNYLSVGEKQTVCARARVNAVLSPGVKVGQSGSCPYKYLSHCKGGSRGNTCTVSE